MRDSHLRDAFQDVGLRTLIKSIVPVLHGISCLRPARHPYLNGASRLRQPRRQRLATRVRLPPTAREPPHIDNQVNTDANQKATQRTPVQLAMTDRQQRPGHLLVLAIRNPCRSLGGQGSFATVSKTTESSSAYKL